MAPRLPAPAVRRRLGGAALAGGARRARRDAHGVGDLLRGARPRPRAAPGQRARHPARRPDPDGVGHGGPEGPLPRTDPVGRGDLVPGVLRARRRLGPRRAQDARRARRRRLAGHRAEGLDQRGAAREVVHARRSNRRRRGQAQGPHLLPDGHGPGGGAGPAAAPDHGRVGVQRAVHRGRPDPRRPRRRRRRQRLEGRAHDADERAGRPRVLPPGAAAPAARRPDRRGGRARAARRRRGRRAARGAARQGGDPAADGVPRADRDREVRPARARRDR